MGDGSTTPPVLRPADAMLRILRDEGVRKVFGNPGTSELPFIDALASADDIEYVLGVHEGSVVAMADGYARATGRPAFVSLHIAAGLANGLIGLLNASRSRTPLVVTAGHQDRRHLASDPMLSGDLIGLARAAVKHTFDVQHAHDLPIMLRRAFALAVQPPAGPVFLSIPMDLLQEDTLVALPAKSVVAPLGPPADLTAATDLLARSARPAIVAGDGVGRANAVPSLVALADRLGATVYHQPLHDGVNFPASHPGYAGALEPTNQAIHARLEAHDVVFIVGCHAFMAHHYTPGPAVPHSVSVVQLDPDAAEIGRNFPVAAGLTGGIQSTLDALTDLLPARPRITTGHRQLRAETNAKALARYGPPPFDPLAAVHAIAAAVTEDTVVVEEAITSGVLLRSVLSLDLPGSLVHTVGGGLGSGIGAAVGTRLADPHRPVVAVLGDGCTMFGLQGLWSAAHYGVPVTFVVMNNGEYRTLKETLDRWGAAASQKAGHPALTLTPPALDFTTAASFFGIDAARPESLQHLTELVTASLTSPVPFLIDVPITAHDPAS